MAESRIARMKRVGRRRLPGAPLLLAVMLAHSPGSRAAQVAPVQATAQISSQPGPQTGLGERQAASVEKHIATLHGELRITPAQEPLWQPLAAAMRAGVVQLDHVYAQREKRQGSMSAVDDLISYGLVQQTRARNVQSLVAPFQKLYGSFNASQRRQADETFREFTENAVKSAR